jgi:hypothetical protein
MVKPSLSVRSAQARRLWLPGLPVTAPCTGNRHIDLFLHLTPGQTLITQLHDLISGGAMCGRTGRRHDDAGALRLLADRARMNAQLGTDLAKGPALGVQLGRMLNAASP